LRATSHFSISTGFGIYMNYNGKNTDVYVNYKFGLLFR